MHPARRITAPCLFAITLLGFLPPALFSAEEAAPPPEDHTADFNILTTDFTRLDAIFAGYNDPLHKVHTSGYIGLLKTRATQLGWKAPKGMSMGSGGGRGAQGGGDGFDGAYGRKGGAANIQFDQVKYDELRYDINLQYQRIANFLAPLRTPPPTPQGERGATIDISKIHPNPANSADTKAALELADREIMRLEARSGGPMIGSPAREAEGAKINRVKARRAALGQEFTVARWDELVGEFSAVR